MRCRLIRTVAFHARHRMKVAPWDVDHGHLYRVEVAVTGPLDPVTQGVVDLSHLDRVLEEVVLRPLDGQHLNDVVPPFAAGAAPTGEALAVWLWTRIAARLNAPATLEMVTVFEDDTLRAECLGPR